MADKRVFTKFMYGGKELTDAEDAISPAQVLDTWVAQEDLSIVGWHVHADAGYAAAGYPTADGAYEMIIELTFSSIKHQDATFARVSSKVGRLLFGSPASGGGWEELEKELNVQLPDGRALSFTEGETLTMLLAARQDTGAVRGFTGIAIIYYVKGKPRP